MILGGKYLGGKKLSKEIKIESKKLEGGRKGVSAKDDKETSSRKWWSISDHITFSIIICMCEDELDILSINRTTKRL